MSLRGIVPFLIVLAMLSTAMAQGGGGDPFGGGGDGGGGGGEGGGGTPGGGDCTGEGFQPDTRQPQPTTPALSVIAGNARTEAEWTPATAPGGHEITRYILYRLVTADCYKIVLQNTSRAHVDLDVVNDQAYTYRVQVESRPVGDGSPAYSNYSESVTVKPREPPRPPGPPANVTADGVPGGVRLTWSAPREGAAASYTLYRAGADGRFGWVPAHITARSYVDADAAPGTTWRYQVAAISPEGIEGPNSGIVSGVALPPPVVVKVDPPTVALSQDALDASMRGWSRTPVAVTLVASGNGSIEYRLDDGAVQPFTGPVIIGNGNHVLMYRGVADGEAGEWTARSFRVDSAAPSGVEWIPETGFPVAGKPSSLVIKATDPGSGVASVRARVLLNGTVHATLGGFPDASGEWRVSWTPPFGGVFDLEVEVTDAAGNVARLSNLKLPVEGKPVGASTPSTDSSTKDSKDPAATMNASATAKLADVPTRDSPLPVLAALGGLGAAAMLLVLGRRRVE